MKHIILLYIAFLTSVFGQDNLVIIPAPMDEVLSNPGIGVETFYEGSQPKNYPDSRIYYWRFNWIDIETKKGEIDFAKIDKKLSNARARGQRVGIRINAVNDYGCSVCVPQYVRDAAGGKMVGAGEDGGQYARVFWPNYNKAFLDAIENLMTALGKKYDGHPDLNHVDIGFFGCWGEYNSACTTDKVNLWTEAIRNRNTDIHLNAFPTTTVIAQGGDSYANSKGAGWRGDCFGDWGMFGSGWNHMENAYPAEAKTCDDCWKTGMVSFEVCGVLNSQYKNKYDFEKTMNMGLDWHMSSMNAKSSAVPLSWMPILNKALNRMGYRYNILKLEHASVVPQGGVVSVKMDWENKGVAPSYHDYILRMELTPASGGPSFTHDFKVDVKTWLPGLFKVEEEITIPSDLKKGKYKMMFALLFPDTEEPAIKLGIVGIDKNGWYPLSDVTVVDVVEEPTSVGEVKKQFSKGDGYSYENRVLIYHGLELYTIDGRQTR